MMVSIAMMVAIAAMPSTAQDDTFARVDQLLRKAARCLIAKDQPAVEALAYAEPGSGGEKAAMAELRTSGGNCLSSGAVADSDGARSHLAGVAAEYLYLGVVAHRHDTSGWSEALKATMRQGAAAYADVARPGQVVLSCLATFQPDLSDQLLRTRPGSRRERATIDRIISFVPGCLFEGQQVHLIRTALRGQIARIEYRNVVAGSPFSRRRP